MTATTTLLQSVDSTIAVLERYVGLRHTRRLHRLPGHFGPALLRLGNVYDQADAVEPAIAAHGRLIELWRHADPELQPDVEHAARRIPALGDDNP